MQPRLLKSTDGGASWSITGDIPLKPGGSSQENAAPYSGRFLVGGGRPQTTSACMCQGWPQIWATVTNCQGVIVPAQQHNACAPLPLLQDASRGFMNVGAQSTTATS